MANVVAPQGQDVVFHYVIAYVTLLKKQDTVTINV